MKNKVLVLGVTGGFGSGKTTVAGMFKTLGAIGLDADKIYHELIKPKGLLYKRIISSFGREILGNHNKINRKKMAKLVFGKREALEKLCRLTHPVVIKKIRFNLSILKRANACGPIVIDAPLLIEAGLLDAVDKLIVVKIDKKKQLARCKKERGLSCNEALRRIRAQAPMAKKIKLADYVVDNNGTLKQTREQVREIWKQIS